jgi:hypothetical protein
MVTCPSPSLDPDSCDNAEWTDLAFQQQQHGTPTILVFGAAALFVFLVLVEVGLGALS